MLTLTTSRIKNIETIDFFVESYLIPKFSSGKEVFWFKGESLKSGNIHIIYTNYLVTKGKDVINIEDCYFSEPEAIEGMRKALGSLELL